MRSSSSKVASKKFELDLPVDKYNRHILYSLERSNVLLVIGDTGSGKSTRIPEILLSAGVYNPEVKNNDSSVVNGSTKRRQVCVTQPRRVAAQQLALRVSQNIGCDLGSFVGYSVRFDDVTSDETLLKFMTEGLLLRELLDDPLLENYSVIMVDEVHERNLQTDLLLGFLRCLLMKRVDLKLIVCSATMNIDEIYKYLTIERKPPIVNVTSKMEPVILSIPGKRHSIKIYHRSQPIPDYLEAMVETIKTIHENSRLVSGKILAFLTGQDEVKYVCDKLETYSHISASRLDLRRLVILPLYSSLKPEQILRIFQNISDRERVCIVATNIAETSITIDDVTFVVDSGFTKSRILDSNTGIDSLIRIPISKSSAKQRAGRAGRTRDGIVYRLYRQEDYERLNDETIPEIQRSSLAEPLMLLMSMGVKNPAKFPLLSKMPKNNLLAGLELLKALKVIDESGNLSPEGEMMARLNIDPKLAKFIISSASMNCSLEACKIVAMLQVKDIYMKPNYGTVWSNESLTKVCVSEGDLPSYLNIMNGFLTNARSQRWAEKRNLNYQALMNAVKIFGKLESQLRRLNIKLTSCARLETIQKSIVLGLFSNAAYLHPSGNYQTIRGDQVVHIHPLSVFNELIDRPQYVVYSEITHTSKIFMHHITSIDSDWLTEAAPHFYSFATELEMRRDIS